MTENSGLINPQEDSKPGVLTHSDYLTLWLNYEAKIDALRSSFLTIAGILFALQSGVFVLMLDKLFDTEELSLRLFLLDITIASISILIWKFLSNISEHFTTHINRNVERARLSVESSYPNSTPKNIEMFQKYMKNNLTNSSSNHIKQASNCRSDPNQIIKRVQCIYYIVLWFTMGGLILYNIFLLCPT